MSTISDEKSTQKNQELLNDLEELGKLGIERFIGRMYVKTRLGNVTASRYMAIDDGCICNRDKCATRCDQVERISDTIELLDCSLQAHEGDALKYTFKGVTPYIKVVSYPGESNTTFQTTLVTLRETKVKEINVIRKKRSETLYPTQTEELPTLWDLLVPEERAILESPGLCSFHDYSTYKFVECDEFTNMYITSSYITSIFRKERQMEMLFNVLNVSAAGICKGAPTIIVERGDNRSLDISSTDNRSTLRRNTIYELMKQIICVLHLLQQYEFSHGKIKPCNFFTKRASIEYDYKGIHVDSDYTWKMCTSKHSSITLRGKDDERVRIFTGNAAYRATIGLKKFTPEVTFVVDTGALNATEYYTITDATEFFILGRMRHMGIPYYLTLDTYLFLVSMMFIPIIWETFITNKDSDVHNIWNELWLNNEGEDVKDAINSYHDKLLADTDKRRQTLNRKSNLATEKQIINVLIGKKLKCNITNILFTLLGGSDEIVGDSSLQQVQ